MFKKWLNFCRNFFSKNAIFLFPVLFGDINITIKYLLFNDTIVQDKNNVNLSIVPMFVLGNLGGISLYNNLLSYCCWASGIISLEVHIAVRGNILCFTKTSLQLF